MDDFDTFKASREKIDPTSRKMTDHQWEQAYVAYCSSRERVGEGRKKKSGESSRRRKGSSGRAASSPVVAPSRIVRLRNEVRQSSAYNDLRMMIDLLAWIAIGVVILTGAVKLVYFTNGSVALVAILSAVFQVITVVVMRLLVHVIIDIPDIALHEQFARENSEKNQDSGE